MRTTSNGRPVGAIRACWIHVYDAISAHPMCRDGELSVDPAVISERTRCASTTGQASGTTVSLRPPSLLPGPVLPQSGRSERPAASVARHGRRCGVHATTLRVFFTYCHKRGQRTATTTLYELLQVAGVPVVKAGNRAMVSQGKSAALTHWVAISCAQIRNRSAVPRGYRNTFALCEARRGSLATKRAVAWRLRACSCYPRQRQQVRRT